MFSVHIELKKKNGKFLSQLELKETSAFNWCFIFFQVSKNLVRHELSNSAVLSNLSAVSERSFQPLCRGLGADSSNRALIAGWEGNGDRALVTLQCQL